jgi:nitrite reductase (NADH) large subunit
MDNLKTIVVVGNGMVGYKFCEKFVNKVKNKSNYKIIVFGEEILCAYDRVHLSSYYEGKTYDDLLLAPESWYIDNGIELHLGDPVIEIDSKNNEVKSHKGLKISYDYLVLATGSSPFIPNIKGIELDGVFVYRTLEDLDLIKNYAKKCKTGVVLGGGLLGLEAAKALFDLKIQNIHVVEFANRLMPRQIDGQASEILQGLLKNLGINTHLSKNTVALEGKNNRLSKIIFADGTELRTDILVISAGIRPRDELAQKCGLKIGERGGIVVNEKMQTSVPNIYAIGECALFEGVIYGLVAPGYEMADVAVDHIVGISQKSFSSYDMSTKLKLVGIDVASIGNPFLTENEASSIVFLNPVKGIYKKIVSTKDGKHLLGAILVGDASSYNSLLQVYRNKSVLPPDPEDLILGTRGGTEGATGIESLSDEALICSCESVSKIQIVNAVKEQNADTVDKIKKCCKAGTGCGGCLPLVKDIINFTLKQLGIVVQKQICEHFPYSRQQLLDLVKYHQIKTFDELIQRFGKGHGCEICKPAVASILASTWNDMVLNKPHAHLQDTNDKFLANIQKGGSYSIVPRVPGGEITPDKLIKIGEIAKKYNLYTKITGGQRIDMFGARVDQLPDIWEELINAGFESGHAYAKALRTVKSCVGSTWCRYGVQDSVSFAIKIEERYKGLRAPHKIKAAVSGCTRECAEAQSKDFGLIATEKGYNLYVCGNGGMKPQHAVLLAQDLDEETCIKYIDRFLMFYIRTADPLTRTSVWLNKMEGGINYLRSVIIDDCLGIAEELEKEMQFMVDTYQCEWKAVVQNPELRARFKSFVNTNEQDKSLMWKEQRGQKIPNAW